MTGFCGVSYPERWKPVLQPSNASLAGRSIREDLTGERLQAVIEIVKDLFT